MAQLCRIRRLAPAGAIVALLTLSSCGGSSKPHTATSITPGGAVSGPQSLLDHLPPINEFPLLRPISAPNVVVSPGVWVANLGLPGTPGQAEAARLARLGFVSAVEEQLGSDQPVAEVDAEVEQFRTTGAANTELRDRFATARSTGQSPGYSFGRFRVTGVPGGLGYAIDQPANTTDAVVFAAGPYFYLIQSIIPTASPRVVGPQQLNAEAGAWYRHLRSL